MAQPPDRTYFPPLDRCLDGETSLLSWKLVASALSDASYHRLASAAVSDFLRDSYVLSLIKSPSKTFEAPSPQSRSGFETKTAAIHVTPTPNGKYDINTIREDALWLSSAVNISEVAALRVVVVEFQSRAQSYLAGPLSSQDVANIQDASGAGSGQATSALAFVDLSLVADAESLSATFEKEGSRRHRLLRAYLSERRYFMMSADYVTSLMLHPVQPQKELAASASALRKDITRVAYRVEGGSDTDIRIFMPLVSAYLDVIPGCLKRFDAGPESVIKPAVLTSHPVQDEWCAAFLAEAVHAMAVVFQILDLSSHMFATPLIISRWFQFVDEFQFLSGLSSDSDSPAAISELVTPIKCLVCAISLAMLNLDRCIAYFDQEIDVADREEAYIFDSDALGIVNSAVFQAGALGLVTASPVVFAWTLIVHRMHAGYEQRAALRDTAQNQRALAGFERESQPHAALGRRSSAGSIVSIEPARYDRFLTEAVLQPGQDVTLYENLARAATSGGQVYDLITDMATCAGDGQYAAFRPAIGSRIRLLLLDFLKAGFPVVGYQSEPVTALLAVLSGDRGYWGLTKADLASPDETVVASALGDPLILQFYVRQALARYPLEFMPFTTLCRILSTCLCTDDRSEVVIKSLVKTPSLAFRLPADFEDYYLTREGEEETGEIRFQTTNDLPLFPPLSSWKRRLPDEKVIFVPSGSRGRFLVDGSGLVVVDYEHSTVALLGKRLDVNLAADVYDTALGFLQPAETAEAISLLATMIRAASLKTAKPAEGVQAGLAILQEASRELPHTKDVVTVVCDTLDTFIQNDSAGSEDSTMTVLASCLEFLHAALPVCPGRVWSYMFRSSLLNTEARAGRLSRLIGASEMASERLSFLLSSIRFLSSLIDNAMSSAVERKVGAKLGGRQKDNEHLWLGTSDGILGQVSLSVAQTAIDIFENTTTWKFPSELDRAVLVGDVVLIMNHIVCYAFGLADADDGIGSLTGCLKPAAKYIIDSFLSPSSTSNLRFQPLLASLTAALGLPSSTLYPRRAEAISASLAAVLEFATTLLRVASHLGKSSPLIESQLFKAASVLARLCAVRDSFQAPAIGLLDALVTSAGMGTSEPPSFLGYLGTQVSKSLLQILSNVDKPFRRPSEAVRIWRFFATIVRNRQQWMANCLLTGKTPREALDGDAKVSNLSSDSVLGTAKETLRSISSISAPEALAVLDFFTSAQNYWPWTIFAIQKETDFLDELRKYARGLKSASVTARADALGACQQARIAAYLAETFAMQMYHVRQMGGEQTLAKDMVRDLDYFLRDGVGVSGYNTSLHVNFQRNLAKRYPGCSLSKFKRTLLSPQDLGAQHYYALDIAEEMLAFDSAWAGARDDGFRNEMQTANLNLSLVDAQIALFQAWEFLLLELSVCLLPKDQSIIPAMLQVAQQCLTANQNLQGPEQIFVKISQARASLALTLIQRLADCSMLPGDSSQLLVAIWSTISGVENPFGREQLQYYRTLLKTLYVILRGSYHSEGRAGEEKQAGAALMVNVSQTVLNILDRVVAQGFRILVALIHDPDATAYPEDVALITAVLQACLSVPGMDECQTQILNIMASGDVLHVATSLFSWSDKLAEKGDPIYGELSLLFLLELSSVPAVAEQLACDGLLGHLTTASLATRMRRPNVSPFADSTGAQRCYNVWTKAVLPLLLNVLATLQTTIAPEVAYVLRQFPSLLESSVQRFEAPGMSRTSSRHSANYITLRTASEVHSLALLTRILGALRTNSNRDIPEVDWDAAPLAENVDFWLSRPKLLRERLLPLGQREAEWRNMKPLAPGGQAENRLEEKVVALLEAVKLILSDDVE